VVCTPYGGNACTHLPYSPPEVLPSALLPLLLLDGTAGSPRLLHQLPDTMGFLQLLCRLHAPVDGASGAAAEPLGPHAGAGGAAELPEVRAARVLFR